MGLPSFVDIVTRQWVNYLHNAVTLSPVDIDTEGTFEVLGPSGSTYTVLSPEEVAYWEDKSSRYLSDNHFINVSDLQEVDRMMMMELMTWRWANWISTGKDYWNDPVDEAALQKQLKEFSTELRLIKKGLGIDKGTRDKDKGDSVSDYLENLRRRAKEFGYHREQQLSKSLVLFNELRSLVTLMDNCTPDEQREMHCSQEDVFSWIRETAIPEYEAIDEHFRRNQQRLWVRTL